ncbi:hypothetical protein JAO76_12435 [Pontibacter sp. BT310]|uniref:Uncharacterized protein n=1 Tax=Pontibacter populi TaxID=890055 RepID=A0ABS6XCY3_9BACT|nr:MULTISPECIES: hypothetical protein [Pontibacter]MBJ6119006.1 hypothetical protein [Pontibacter sp. BT310]MBR0571434.1 hypothetical protein [Microvirga sp. STS03]MBW3365860.1 hypothetical protein [Pontibacter populi]
MLTKYLLSAEPSEFSDSCLFLSAFRLQRAYCPFQVVCIKAIRSIEEGERKRVDKVLSWNTGTILFYIQGKLYPHHHFSYRPPTQFVATAVS